MEKRIETVLDFLKEIEKFKHVERKNYKTNDAQENDAEHSWHLAMFLILFEKELPEDADMTKMLKLALMHDLCELYAGDTCAFDDEGHKNKYDRELESAKKLFSQLPDDLNQEFMDLFDEYEHSTTKEAKIVKSFDKMQPLLQNMAVGGIGWRKNNITIEMVDNYKRKHMQHDPVVFNIYKTLLEQARDQMITMSKKD